MIDVAACENLLRKTAEEGYELLEEMATSSYHPQSERNTPRRNAGVHQVTDFSAVTAQLEALNRKIDSMNVNGTAMRLQEIFCEKCGGEHYVKDCQDSGPFYVNEEAPVNQVGIPNRPRNDPYSNTYNLGWRQLPNFSWGGQGSQTRPQGGQQYTLRNGKVLEQEEKEKEDQRNGAIDTSTSKSSKSTPTPTAQSTIAIPPPFPAALRKAKLDAQFCKFLEILKKLHINIPFADALMQIPSYAKFLKDILANKRKLEDHMTINLTENCSALVQNKIPSKLKDPGTFSIPCVIGDIVFHKALCDLGASINLMPLSVFRKLGLGEPKTTRMSLQLVDRSVKYPRGVIEDVLVKVDKFIFPVDFVVLDMEEDVEMPLILGRPFLVTGKALIDVQEGKLRLRLGEEEITFDVFTALKHTLHTDSCIRIDVVDSLVCNFVQEAMKDPLEATLTTELEDDDLDEEKAEIVAYFNTNHPWRKPMRMRLEDLGEHRDLTPPKSSIEEPPTLELKPLPPHLKYVYIGENNTLPVIISAALTDAMEEQLLQVLKEHKKAFAWKVADIKGISPSICMHKILMEEKYSPLVQPQRRLNPKMQEVVKAETIKLLDSGIIYPISDSAWVSPVQCVPKKGGITVITNEKNELILMRTVTGWRNLRSVLRRCEETNLVLNWEKCHFMVQEGIVLGHKISEYGIEVDKAKVEVIKNLPPPTSIKGAYEDLKERLVTAPVLVALDWDLPFEVMCDASDAAVGVVLGQRRNKAIDDWFPDEQLFEVKYCPWCVAEEEFGKILNHCHDREVGGHFGPTKTASKVLECVFYWPTLFKDARSYVITCDKCQRTELEHRAYWATKALNFNCTAAGERRLLQLD
ncbi:uncharacterized protein LOC142528385 [Primulina tabacum]|uniref:uncharacterized protein LOC142528385 n=1 Tax=Primulina tabacum TaxID=48773 RepID=UPI003F5AD21F